MGAWPGRQEEFEAAAEEAKVLAPEPEDSDKLQLYALFKQATVGDVNIGEPFSDLPSCPVERGLRYGIGVYT